MPIVIHCACGKQLRVADDSAGKRARCPGCNALHSIPSRGPQPASASIVEAASLAATPDKLDVATLDFPAPEIRPDPSTLDAPGVATPSLPPRSRSEAPTRDFTGPLHTTLVPIGGHFGDYDLLHEIARGGMGVVFKARQKSLNRIVAVKMILSGQLASPEQVRRFHVEAEEAGQLDHPHIVPIYQVGEERGQHYFVMKLIEGGSLCAHVDRLRRSPDDTARLIAIVSRAVHYAHQRGILHRDLKPGNILIDEHGEPHVTDFGLAKHLGQDGPGTQSGAILGTPGYMAPEQAAGRKDLTVAADVHGLGAVLYELLSGRPPFHAETAMSALHQVMDRDATPLRQVNPQVPADLETITQKCLQKDPGRRYVSALALAEDLDRYVQGEPIRARPVTTAERAWKWARKRPAWAALAGVVLLAGLGLTVGGWWYNVRLREALAKATASEREANRSFEQSLERIDDMIINLDGRLAHKDGMGSVRIEFLREFQRFGQQLLKERPGDPVARRQVGRLAARLADVYYLRDMGDEGDEAFRQAVEIQKELVAESDDPQYPADLALTYAQYARLHQRREQPQAAMTALLQAFDIQDKLAKQYPDQPEYRSKAERYRFELANAQESGGLPAEARAGYTQALQRLEKLQEEHPSAATLNYLGLVRDSLAFLVAPTDAAEGLRLFQASFDARRQAWLEAKHVSEYESDYRTGYTDLGTFLVAQGRHAELAALADVVAADPADPKLDSYNAACLMALAAKLAGGKGYGDRAMKLFTQATQAGYGTKREERDLIVKDKDLEALRGRADYKAAIAKLDERIPPRVLTPAQEVDLLATEYQSAVKLDRYAQSTAETTAQKKRAIAAAPKLDRYSEQFLQLAERYKDSSAGLLALAWVLEQTSPDDDRPLSPETVRLRNKAMELLERDHLGRADTMNVCRLLSYAADPASDRMLEVLQKRHADPTTRGMSVYGQAVSCMRQAARCYRADASRSQGLLKKAELKLQELAADYDKVAYGSTTLGELARKSLKEVQCLNVGSPAQDIDGEDLYGAKLRLSQFRGKVVVLDFWANWCGFCRQEYDFNKDLVTRLEGKPFALLGINCDENKKEAVDVVKKQGLNWRSWYDGGRGGGRIQGQWGVDSFPSVFVLDHKGVIRHKNLRGTQLEVAVLALLREAEADTKK